MKHAKPSKVYRTILVVEGTGEFPIDMLRYDACCPDTEEDSFELVRREYKGTRTVSLRRFSLNGSPANEARWRSRGWRVVSEEPYA